MPTLLQINITANWGSTGKIAEAIGRVAIAHGWDSYIAFGRWNNPSESHLIKVGKRWDKYLHFAEQRIRDNEGLCSRSATKRLIQQIEDIKPNVVQLHNIHDHYLNYELLFEYLNHSSIKVVWTFHDCWAFTGHCFHFVTMDCKRWMSGCHNCPMRSILPKTLFDRSKENYQLKKNLFCDSENLTIVSVSDWMAGFVKQSFLKDKRIEVIKNGVDLTIFRPVNVITDDNTYGILAVSSVWNKDKGLNDIYKLRDLLPSSYMITVVGVSQKQISKFPRGILGIQRTQDVEALVNLYSNANVLINPTYADTFPTVNIESLACGTPVVTYRTGGSPEAVSPSTGVVVEQGDIFAMAEAIKNICDADRAQYMIDCRKSAEDNYDKDKCFKKYIELYEVLIGS